MAGTDHAAHIGWEGPTPVMVLVRPQMGENIGAAARAMWNFGLDRLRIVDPRDGWPNPAAVATSSGAAPVMDQVKITDTVEDAVGDLTYLFATTARQRDLTKTVMTPERAMSHAREMIAQGQKVGVLFGPERAGLETADVVRANALISVPVNPAFASLNLAQCVLLLAYEWRRQTGDAVPEVYELARGRMAQGQEVTHLLQHLVEKLDARGFFWPEDKAESMRSNLENLLRRMPLTESDIRMFHGIVRYLADRAVKE